MIAGKCVSVKPRIHVNLIRVQVPKTAGYLIKEVKSIFFFVFLYLYLSDPFRLKSRSAILAEGMSRILQSTFETNMNL